MPTTITLRGKEYPLKISSTAYIRLAVLIKPVDGGSLADMELEKPENLEDENRRQKAIADRARLATALADRLGDDITTRRLAYALKSVCPQLEADGLVKYEHLIRPDDMAKVEFDVDLEISEVLDIAALVSNAVDEAEKAKKAKRQENKAEEPKAEEPKAATNGAAKNRRTAKARR